METLDIFSELKVVLLNPCTNLHSDESCKLFKNVFSKDFFRAEYINGLNSDTISNILMWYWIIYINFILYSEMILYLVELLNISTYRCFESD